MGNTLGKNTKRGGNPSFDLYLMKILGDIKKKISGGGSGTDLTEVIEKIDAVNTSVGTTNTKLESIDDSTANTYVWIQRLRAIEEYLNNIANPKELRRSVEKISDDYTTNTNYCIVDFSILNNGTATISIDTEGGGVIAPGESVTISGNGHSMNPRLVSVYFGDEGTKSALISYTYTLLN